MSLGVKKCTVCNKKKSLLDFYKRSEKKDGKMAECKVCHKKRIKEYGRTKIGLSNKIYHGNVRNSKLRGDSPPLYNKKEFIKWLNLNSNFHIIFLNWKKSGYKKELVPSIDRLNDYMGYSFNNIRITTWGENESKYRRDVFLGNNRKACIPVIGINILTKEEIEFFSIANASRSTNTHASNIHKTLKGKRKKAGNFVWIYK